MDHSTKHPAHHPTHLSKKEVRSPDEFIKTSGAVLAFIEKHLRSIGFALAAFIAVGLLYSGYEVWRGQQEAKATDAFFQVKKTREKVYRDFQKTLEGKRKDAELKKDKSAAEELAKQEPPYSDEIAQSYKGFLQTYGKTQTGLIAAIELGGYLSEHQKSQEALDALQLVPEKNLGKGMLTALYYTLAGRIQADLNNCEKAIQNWEKPLKDMTQKAFHPDLLLRTAICFEKTNQKDRAVQNYDRLINEYSQSRAAESAKTYKRLLERQKS